MEPDDYISKAVSWEISNNYADLIKSVLDNQDKKKLFNPEIVTPDQAVRHAETPALKRAWDDYITLWKLTHGD